MEGRVFSLEEIIEENSGKKVSKKSEDSRNQQQPQRQVKQAENGNWWKDLVNIGNDNNQMQNQPYDLDSAFGINQPQQMYQQQTSYQQPLQNYHQNDNMWQRQQPGQITYGFGYGERNESGTLISNYGYPGISSQTYGIGGDNIGF